MSTIVPGVATSNFSFDSQNIVFTGRDFTDKIIEFLPSESCITLLFVNVFLNKAALWPSVEKSIFDFFQKKNEQKIAQMSRMNLLIGKLKKMEPNHVFISLTLGEIARIKQNHPQMLSHYAEASGNTKIMYANYHFLLQGRLGIYYHATHQKKEALELLEKSYKTFPDDPVVMSTLGSVLLETRPAEAKILLETAFKQDPKDFLVVANSINGFEKTVLGFTQMKQRLMTYINECPFSPQIIYLLAEKERSGGRPKILPNPGEAFKYYSMILDNEAFSKEETYGLALARRSTLGLGRDCPRELYDPHLIQHDLEKALETFPHNFSIMRECALAFTTEKEKFLPQYAKAVACLGKVVASQAENRIKADACYKLGLLHGSGGFGLEKNLEKARTWYREVLKYNPTHAEALRACGLSPPQLLPPQLLFPNSLPPQSLPPVSAPIKQEVIKKILWFDYQDGTWELASQLIDYVKAPYSKKLELSAKMQELVKTLECIDPNNTLISLCNGEECLMKQDTEGAIFHFKKIKPYADLCREGFLSVQEEMKDLCSLVLSRVGISEYFQGNSEESTTYFEMARKIASFKDVRTLVYFYYATLSDSLAQEILTLWVSDDPEFAACSVMIIIQKIKLSGDKTPLFQFEVVLKELQTKFPQNILINYYLAELYRNEKALRKDFEKSYHHYSLAVQDTTLRQNPHYCHALARRATLLLYQDNETDEQREQAAKDLNIAERAQDINVLEECAKGEKILYAKRVKKIASLYGITSSVFFTKMNKEAKKESRFMNDAVVEEIADQPAPGEAKEIASLLIKENKFADAKPYLEIAYKANRLDPAVCYLLLKISLDERDRGIQPAVLMEDVLAAAWEIYDTIADPLLKEQIDRSMR